MNAVYLISGFSKNNELLTVWVVHRYGSSLHKEDLIY